MRSGVEIRLTPEDRIRLDRIVAERNTPQKHVWRARIVLLTADGHGTSEIMRRASVAKTAALVHKSRPVASVRPGPGV